MRTHIQILGWLHIVGGILCILGGIAAVAFGFLAGAAAGSMGGHTGSAAAVGGMIGLVVGGVLVIAGIPGTFVGFGLLKQAPWARIGGIILAIFEVLSIVGAHRLPIGVIVGIYGLWVLFNQETVAIFEGRG